MSPTRKEPTENAQTDEHSPDPRLAVPLVLVFFLLFAAACSSDSSTTATDTTPAAGGGTGTTTGGATCGKKITLGYSAWPGWFPLAVADKEGIFDKARPRRRPEVLRRLHRLARRPGRRQLDANTQTLNDTMFGVAVGQRADHRRRQRQLHRQRRHHLRQQSINTIDDLKGKTIAAEPGVVDHFLLLQGLARRA